jgi:hypothetical protein
MPRPMPVLPWQVTHCFWYSASPLARLPVHARNDHDALGQGQARQGVVAVLEHRPFGRQFDRGQVGGDILDVLVRQFAFLGVGIHRNVHPRPGAKGLELRLRYLTRWPASRGYSPREPPWPNSPWQPAQVALISLPFSRFWACPARLKGAWQQEQSKSQFMSESFRECRDATYCRRSSNTIFLDLCRIIRRWPITLPAETLPTCASTSVARDPALVAAGGVAIAVSSAPTLLAIALPRLPMFAVVALMAGFNAWLQWRASRRSGRRRRTVRPTVRRPRGAGHPALSVRRRRQSADLLPAGAGRRGGAVTARRLTAAVACWRCAIHAADVVYLPLPWPMPSARHACTWPACG